VIVLEERYNGAMPRYELSEGKSSKFWQVTLRGKELVVHFGRIGSTGQQHVKKFATAAAATKAYDQLIAEKTNKGYAIAKSDRSRNDPRPSARQDESAPPGASTWAHCIS
jgi:predicted DNA-binding WGR domain protein